MTHLSVTREMSCSDEADGVQIQCPFGSMASTIQRDGLPADNVVRQPGVYQRDTNSFSILEKRTRLTRIQNPKYVKCSQK